MPIKTPAQIDAEVRRIAGRGIEAAARFFANRLREVLSVPAPRRRAIAGPRARVPGAVYYIAMTPAIPGAPPRKLSGQLRRSVAVDFNQSTNVARVGTSPIYGPRLERQGHPYLGPTLQTNLTPIATIIGGAFTIGGNI